MALVDIVDRIAWRGRRVSGHAHCKELLTLPLDGYSGTRYQPSRDAHCRYNGIRRLALFDRRAPLCLCKRNEPPPLFIPQGQPHAPQTLEQGDSSDGSELWMVAQHIRQAIARNSTAQVMDVVNADIRREPAQNTRQVIVRTAMDRSFVKTPGFIVGPGSILELVLDIEQPDTDRRGQNQDRELHKQERPKADQPDHRGDHNRDRSVRAHSTQ